MTASKTPKPEVHWDQTAFEALRAAWSAERIAEDEQRLQEVFNLAADVPLLAEALDWATAHGMKFFIDHSVTGLMGYYQPGTGVLSISRNAGEDPLEAVTTIVHEIRHAWQEYHNMAIGYPDSFSEYFIKLALTEADAEAFGLRAGDQFHSAALKKNGLPTPIHLRESLSHETADLEQKFLSWFSDPLIVRRYGDDESKSYGQDYGVYRGKMREDHAEYSVDVPEAGGEMSIENVQDVLPLGRGFTGGRNYLSALPPDTLLKKILRPSLADTFWGAANDNQRKLTAKIRKAYLQEKLSGEPQP